MHSTRPIRPYNTPVYRNPDTIQAGSTWLTIVWNFSRVFACFPSATHTVYEIDVTCKTLCIVCLNLCVMLCIVQYRVWCCCMVLCGNELHVICAIVVQTHYIVLWYCVMRWRAFGFVMLCSVLLYAALRNIALYCNAMRDVVWHCDALSWAVCWFMMRPYCFVIELYCSVM